jgi:hypothetical protein
MKSKVVEVSTPTFAFLNAIGEATYLEHAKKRTSSSYWGINVTEKLPPSLARNDSGEHGWAEFFFRLPDPKGTKGEIPARHDCYKGIEKGDVRREF